MGVQDVPEPFQNAVSFELVKQSAFMIDFRRILGAIWEGFGGQRLPPRTRLSVIKTIVGRLEASRSLKHHFGRFLEAKWYPFGSILDEFWVRVVRNLDAPGCITNPTRCHTNNFRGYLRLQDCSSIISLKHLFRHLLEAKWYHFEPILDEFWVPVRRNFDASSKARWRKTRARALDSKFRH